MFRVDVVRISEFAIQDSYSYTFYKIVNLQTSGKCKGVEELQDVKDALKGKVTKSKLRSLSKKSLVEHAKEKFDIELDMSSTKTNLVNNVYSLHHKK